MQLVENHVLPGAAPPEAVTRGMVCRSDRLAGAEDVIRLMPAGRIRDKESVRQLETIARPGPRPVNLQLKPTRVARLHLPGATIVDGKQDGLAVRCPEAKQDAIILDDRSEGILSHCLVSLDGLEEAKRRTGRMVQPWEEAAQNPVASEVSFSGE
jgi:hypothetical protein